MTTADTEEAGHQLGMAGVALEMREEEERGGEGEGGGERRREEGEQEGMIGSHVL